LLTVLLPFVLLSLTGSLELCGANGFIRNPNADMMILTSAGARSDLPV
jgi:hypothetical protein